MLLPFKYAYLTGDFLLASVWLLLYIKRKDLRFEIIVMSVLSLFWIAVSYVLFASDFISKVWVSEGLGILTFLPLGIHGEDMLFTFFLGGIAAVLYEEILSKKHFKKYRKRNAFIHFALFPLIIFFSLLIGIRFFNINPYYASFVGFLISAGLIWILRRDLFLHSIISGVFLSVIYFIFFAFIFIPLFPGIVKEWWHLSQLSRIFLLGVPMEELMWCFFFGLFIGPSYEFILGLKDRE